MIYLSYVMSLDGKIGDVGGNFYNFSSRRDRERLFFLRAMADVVVVGAETIRRENPPFKLKDEYGPLRRELGKSKNFDILILTETLDISEDSRVFEYIEDRKIYILTGSGNKKSFGENVEIISFNGKIRGKNVVDFLHGRNYEDILVEGGGEVNALFLSEGFVDKIYCTISPIVLGGRENPTPCGGDFFKKYPEFQLVRVERVLNEVFLEYERINLR